VSLFSSRLPPSPHHIPILTRPLSSGGRAEFKWEDVKNDTQRENYLGHSLMAPVGRWQKGKDLNWYAKGDQSADAQTEAEKRKEEIRKIKEAEEDARLVALGLPPRNANANLIPIGEGSKMEEVKAEAPVEDKGKERERRKKRHHRSRDREERKHRHRRHRSESRDGHRHRRHRHRRHRSESRDGDRQRRRRSRSRDRDAEKRRDRSRSPVKRRDEGDRPQIYGGRDRVRSPFKDERRSKLEDSRSPVGRRHHRSRSRSPYHDRRRD
jgi:hypothetical protein